MRVCAVSFLNTVPLVWGMLHGDQQGLFDLEFRLPSECADKLAAGQADIGIVPSIELQRLNLEILRGAGIASHGAIRSILLVSKVAPEEIHTLAADSSSRTSVALARIILGERYGVRPQFGFLPPQLPLMLEKADAALIIGDPALRVDRASHPYRVLDLGEEWWALTGLPMVFAVWAGRPEVLRPGLAEVFLASCRFGRAHLEDIVLREAPARGIPVPLAREYLTRHVVNEFSDQEYRGLEEFLARARRFPVQDTLPC